MFYTCVTGNNRKVCALKKKNLPGKYKPPQANQRKPNS